MKIIIPGIIATTLLSLTGCGSSDSATTLASTATDVTVERGKVFNATVTDSSTPPLVATQREGQNVYTFSRNPTYPINVTDGWIDVDNDGVMTSADYPLDINMTSYSDKVTPITTYLADTNESIREQRLAELVSEMNIPSDELLKLPSEASNDAIALTNSMYEIMKANSSTDISGNLHDVKESYENLRNTATQSCEGTTLDNMASCLELIVMVSSGSSTLTDAEMERFNPIEPATTEPATTEPATTVGAHLFIFNGYTAEEYPDEYYYTNEAKIVNGHKVLANGGGSIDSCEDWAEYVGPNLTINYVKNATDGKYTELATCEVTTVGTGYKSDWVILEY
jgi:hypothetical protein